MNEEWKAIKGYEGIYEVSNTGRVKRISHYSNYKGSGTKRLLKEKMKVIGRDKYGYSIVSLYKGKKMKMCKVHRLVAEAFVPNQLNLTQVNHKDENKNNNNASNLEWCNCLYNNNYGTRNNKISKSKKGHKCYCKNRDEK